MPDAMIGVNGDDNFGLGQNGFIIPGRLQPGEYEAAMNVMCRGGIVQTRPGSNSIFDMPEGKLQGCTLFISTSGVAYLVFAVDGKVYASKYPFKAGQGPVGNEELHYFQLPNIQFYPYSKYVAWASTVQSTDYTNEGILYNLDNPKHILIMQDGNTRAAYWDGTNSGHIDPTPSEEVFPNGESRTVPGKDGTPIGLWMVWSNNRLWVSRKEQIFASDIGNPLKFTEDDYLNEARAFYLPGPCTGMSETSDHQGILCFTDKVGVFLQSSIQLRTLWLTTPAFQTTAIPSVGCAAPRSLFQQYGLLWWMTPRGVVSQDDALRINATSRLDVQDQEMIQSKGNLSYDLSMVCGSFYENFLFHAVPNGHKINTRLHVLDHAPFEDQPINSWPSHWEGWRPVEFARGVISSQERVFCCSFDYDGVNRMWELFKPDRNDNGIPITSYVLGRQHFFENRDYKRFRFVEVEVRALSGPTAVKVAVGGIRGALQTVMTKDLNAVNGQIYSDVLYGFEANSFYGTKTQTRIFKTEDKNEASECNSECVESETLGLIDKAFSVLIVWSGIMGVTAYRVFAQSEPTGYFGSCENDETDENRLLTVDGCGDFELINGEEAFDRFYATATFQRIHPTTGLPVENTSSAMSLISQADADRKASMTARWYVMWETGELI